MNFKAGQKVLCILDQYNSYCKFPLKRGSVYTVNGFYKCACGSLQITLAEITGVTKMGCRCHRTSVRRQSYFIWRFIPMEYFEAFISSSSDTEKKTLSKVFKEFALTTVNQAGIRPEEPVNKGALSNSRLADTLHNIN